MIRVAAILLLPLLVLQDAGRRPLDTGPDSEFAARVRSVLGLPPRFDAAQDSLAQARLAYSDAFAIWVDGRPACTASPPT